MVEQARRRCIRVRIGHDVRDGDFPVDLVRRTYYGGFENLGMGGQCVLDLFGINVLAAADDHVFDAVDESEVAVLVEAAHVAGAQPTFDDCARGLLGSVEIAAHDVRAGNENLSDGTDWQECSQLIGDCDGLARQRRTDRSQFAHPAGRIAG